MFTYSTDALQIEKYRIGLNLHGGPAIKMIPTENTSECRRAVSRKLLYVHGQDPPLTAGGDRKGSAKALVRLLAICIASKFSWET